LDYKRYGTGEFARLAGVTTRTLRYYDQIGLLRPSDRGSAGQRFYCEKDLVRLQQIMALVYLGAPLKEIGRLLEDSHLDAAEWLQLQRDMVVEKRDALDEVIRAIDYAAYMLEKGKWEGQNPLFEVVRVIKMHEHDWRKGTDPELVRKMEERMKEKPYGSEDAQRDAKRWEVVTEGFKKAYKEGLSPSSPEVQELARQHIGLTNEFLEYYKGILTPETKPMNCDQGQLAAVYGGDAAYEYVQKALDIYRNARK
jgi:DNA-binding transcriptional MerR regulator